MKHQGTGVLIGWLVLATITSVMAAITRPVLTNGPASNRINITLLAEGYTAVETNEFFADATDTVQSLLATAPFADYSNSFNALAIHVASAQSGSDHPGTSTANTYFNSTYDAQNGYIISIPPNWANTNYADGRGKVDALLAAHAPATDLAILLVNDWQDGGSDGGGSLAVVAKISAVYGTGVLPHEVGHVLANLGDEYETPNPGYPNTEEPNTTQQTNRAAIKWNAWISTNTPIPTPEDGNYANVVGLFEGAHYQSNGWYRPKLDCRMRTVSTPFCEVCSEALVLSLYDRVRPIEAWSPAATNVAVTSTGSVGFSVGLLRPASHALQVQWFTNGAAVAGATATNLLLQPAAWGNGLHSVQARVFDPTARVRTDPGQLRSQTVTWNLSVTLPWLELQLPSWTTNAFVFRVTGVAPNGFVVERSTNLDQWWPVSTNALAGPGVWVTNSSAPPGGASYRAVVRQ